MMAHKRMTMAPGLPSHLMPMLLVVALIGLMGVTRASAELTNIIGNGEFETPGITAPSGWEVWPSEAVPNWISPVGMELWQEGLFDSPRLGSDGLGTGQHLEMNDSGHEYTQEVMVPDTLLSTTATLRFDAWLRVTGQAAFEVVGSVSGDLAGGSFDMNTTQWTANEVSFDVVPGEMLTLTFTSTIGGPGNSAHLDAVDLIVDVRPAIVGDLDGDGGVGVPDLLLLLAAWGDCLPAPEPCPADLDASGGVGVPDLLLLLANWG